MFFRLFSTNHLLPNANVTDEVSTEKQPKDSPAFLKWPQLIKLLDVIDDAQLVVTRQEPQLDETTFQNKKAELNARGFDLSW